MVLLKNMRKLKTILIGQAHNYGCNIINDNFGPYGCNIIKKMDNSAAQRTNIYSKSWIEL